MGPESANTAKVTKLLENRYMKNFDDKIANLRGLIDMVSECAFVAPTLGAAEKVREAGNKVCIDYLCLRADFAIGESLYMRELLFCEI